MDVYNSCGLCELIICVFPNTTMLSYSMHIFNTLLKENEICTHSSNGNATRSTVFKGTTIKWTTSKDPMFSWSDLEHGELKYKGTNGKIFIDHSTMEHKFHSILNILFEYYE